MIRRLLSYRYRAALVAWILLGVFALVLLTGCGGDPLEEERLARQDRELEKLNEPPPNLPLDTDRYSLPGTAIEVYAFCDGNTRVYYAYFNGAGSMTSVQNSPECTL